MKNTLLFMALCSSLALHAQQDSAAAKPKVAQNNAAAFVSFVEGKTECRAGTASVSLRNSSTDRIIIAIVEMSVTYNGHVNVKDIRVDNFGPQELRNLGCKGCIANPTGQTCTRFRIKGVAFK